MRFLLALVLLAQVAVPVGGQQAYTIDDPVDPDRLGLSTLDGLYSIVRLEGCEDLAAGLNVRVQAGAEAGEVWLEADGLPPCRVGVLARMSDLACFTDEAGVCDVRMETD